MSYITERVTLPVSDVRLWLTLDAETLDVVPEVRDWMLHLSAMDRSPETLRAYGPRVTLFLNWADGFGCDWRSVTLPQMARFRHFVEATPSAHGKPRSAVTVNATLTAVIEFLRYCAHSGLIEPEVADRLSEKRNVSYAPDEGGAQQERTVRLKLLKVREIERLPVTISQETLTRLKSLSMKPRDRFLVEVLADTGLRIGECLGLHRSDMHFLPDSRALGCDISGAHLHVVPRKNENNARAKGGCKTRHVPVSSGVVRRYAEYMAERSDLLPTEDDSDFVFVNLYSREGIGRPMSYSAVKQWFDKISRDIGEPFRPHMLRHTAATTWLHEVGAELDTVQALLGHSSAASTAVYLHPDEKTLRAAIDTASILRSKEEQ